MRWRWLGAGLLFAVAAALVTSAPIAEAKRKKKKSNHFVDAKERFTLDLPHGWDLAPMPGDLHGMMLRRKIGDTPGIFRAHVELARERDTVEDACDRRTADFRGEIGYRKLTDLPVSIAGVAGLRRTHTAFVAGDERLVRYAVDTVFIAYGYVHHLHFETTEAAYASFKPDHEQLLASYQPLAGRKVYGPLIGDWELIGSGGGLRLNLGSDLAFRLGDKQGRYRADGKQLTFITPDGRESFDYDLGDGTLVVRNESLGSPMAYRRAGVGTPVLTDVPKPTAKERSIIGTWRVIDSDLTLQLSPSGAVQFGPLSGRYRIKGRLLTITSAAGVEMTYHFSMHAGRLTLSGGDLERPLVLERE